MKQNTTVKTPRYVVMSAHAQEFLIRGRGLISALIACAADASRKYKTVLRARRALEPPKSPLETRPWVFSRASMRVCKFGLFFARRARLSLAGLYISYRHSGCARRAA